MILTRATSCLVAALLSACIPAGRAPGQPPIDRPSARETAQCHADLTAAGIAFRPLPDRDAGGGCGLFGAVQLRDIGTPATNLGAMRCGAARAFATWVRDDVAPMAERELGSPLARVETMGSYACRDVIGSARGPRRSGHAVANAVDIAAFRLADGRRIGVAASWNGQDDATRDFLRDVRRAACRRFGTVLSPDYNAAHADHLHLEDDRIRFCR